MKTKNMKELHHLPRFSQVVRRPRAVLRNYGNGPSVIMDWDMNELAKRDQIVRLRIGDQTAYLDKQELLHYIRAV